MKARDYCALFVIIQLSIVLIYGLRLVVHPHGIAQLIQHEKAFSLYSIEQGDDDLIIRRVHCDSPCIRLMIVSRSHCAVLSHSVRVRAAHIKMRWQRCVWWEVALPALVWSIDFILIFTRLEPSQESEYYSYKYNECQYDFTIIFIFIF